MKFQLMRAAIGRRGIAEIGAMLEIIPFLCGVSGNDTITGYRRPSAAISPLDHEKLLVMPRSRLIKSSASHGVNSVTFYSVLDIYY